MAAGSGRRFKWLAGAAVLAVALWFAFGREGSYLIVNDPPPGKGPIVAFGDSLVVGHGASPGEGFVEVLLEPDRRDHHQSWRGRRHRGRRGPARLERDVLAAHPRIVLICLGGNDRSAPPSAQGRFSGLRSDDPPHPRTGRARDLDYNRGPMGSRRRGLRPGISRLGAPAPEAWPSRIYSRDSLENRQIMSDSIHPNAQGYIIMADRIEPVLRQYAAKAIK